MRFLENCRNFFYKVVSKAYCAVYRLYHGKPLEFFREGYLTLYPDVAASGIYPLYHYLRYGQKGARLNGVTPPEDFFCGEAYRLFYPDIAAAGIDPWVHYATLGAKEGRYSAEVKKQADFLYRRQLLSDWKKEARLDIITPPHTADTAALLQRLLQQAGVGCTVQDTAAPLVPERFYLVFCPQSLPRLPKKYIVFQTEPLTAAGTWSEDCPAYPAILERALAVWDSSLENIGRLADLGIPEKRLFYLPVAAVNLPAGGAAETDKKGTDYYLNRFLLAVDLISFDAFYARFSPAVQLSDKLCLSLPESRARRAAFARKGQPDFLFFDGLKHYIGWIGCAMSYKFIFKKAIELGLDSITVCEDDVSFPRDFALRYRRIQAYLAGQAEWDVFSGLISNVNDDYLVKQVASVGEDLFVQLNKTVSMVFNIYHRTVFQRLADWTAENHNEFLNQIDRYLGAGSPLCFTTYPFLVEQDGCLASTLWQEKNEDVYGSMIRDSQVKLKQLVMEHLFIHRFLPAQEQPEGSHL